MDKFLEPDFIKFFIPLAGAVLAWFINEFKKQKSEEYLRKEEKYIELLKALKGFYVSSFANEDETVLLKRNFLDQLDQCWLYCPDDVINKGYAFLSTVHTKKISTDEIKEKALGEFIISIRKDLFSHRLWKKTELKAEDFKIYFVSDYPEKKTSHNGAYAK